MLVAQIKALDAVLQVLQGRVIEASQTLLCEQVLGRVFVLIHDCVWW